MILTFTKTESIDVLISELKDVKAMMDGSYDFETERSADEVDYDEYDYCPNCGQRIDWAEVDESEL